MECLFLYAAVLLLAPNFVRASDQCSTSHGSHLKMSVASHRNQTGHWVVKSGLFNSASDNLPREVGLDVEHATTSCTSENSVRLEATATISSFPPEGYQFFPNLGYYKFYDSPLPWELASNTCARDGAHLLVINSEPETVVVNEFFARKPIVQNAGYDTLRVHVGIHDRFKEGQWTTVLGGSLAGTGYSRWHAGEPNGGVNENCVFVLKEALLADGPCTWRLSYICEYSRNTAH